MKCLCFAVVGTSDVLLVGTNVGTVMVRCFMCCKDIKVTKLTTLSVLCPGVQSTVGKAVESPPTVKTKP